MSQACLDKGFPNPLNSVSKQLYNGSRKLVRTSGFEKTPCFACKLVLFRKNLSKCVRILKISQVYTKRTLTPFLSGPQGPLSLLFNPSKIQPKKHNKKQNVVLCLEKGGLC